MNTYRCIYYVQWSSAGWITGCDAAEFERFNFQFQIYSGKHGVRLKLDCRTDLVNQTHFKQRHSFAEGFKILKSKIKPELLGRTFRFTLGVTSTVRVLLPESLQFIIMFEETGPEWLSEEVKTGVSTEFSIMSIRNLVNCYCAALFLTSWHQRGNDRCRFVGMNPEHSCCHCVSLFADNHYRHRVWWWGRAGVWLPSVCWVSFHSIIIIMCLMHLTVLKCAT